MNMIECPKCGKGLIRLEPFKVNEYDFWCDECDIDVNITIDIKVSIKENKEKETE